MDIVPAYVRDKRGNLARLGVRVELLEFGVDLRETCDANEFAAHGAKRFGELSLGVGVGHGGQRLRQRRHWRCVAAQGGEDSVPAVHFDSFLMRSRKLCRGICGSSRLCPDRSEEHTSELQSPMYLV